MSQNRLVDRRLDAENPRTARRALPAGRVTRPFVLAIVVASSALFVFGAWQLNRLVFLLSPVALLVVLGYPFAKRFTALCHLWLGLALGLAPVGAWLAVRGAWTGMETPLLLGVAVMLWTGGFDIIYACQDAEHDRSAGLFSIPARLGVARALALSAVMHVACVALLAALLLVNRDTGPLSWAGLAVATAILAYEHGIVRPGDLSRVNVAFFTLNGLVSLVLGGAIVADALL
jgi:4-hydroxybenzoate polyprenyltransferase